MSFKWQSFHNSQIMQEETTSHSSKYGSIHSNGAENNHRLIIPSRVLTKELEIKHKERLKHNLTNLVKTTKYTLWNCLPKNLFEQFHRFANIYFLAIAIINWLPAIKAFAKEVTMVPLLIVLGVTLVKDLYEDQRRRRSDKEVNNRQCLVYDCFSDKYIRTKWKNIIPGNIVKLFDNEIIPADILLLNTSDTHDICHIETANLDGETNLKQREVLRSLNQVSSNAPPHFSSFIYCEQPNTKIYQFRGYVDGDGNHIPIDQNNLLLRGCVIRNTEYVEGIVIYAGHDTKAMMNNSGPRSKRSKLERDINWDVISCVIILLALCLICAIGCGFWTHNHEEFDHKFTPELDFDNEDVVRRSPALEGFIRFWTYIIVFQVLIPISLYVSVEIVKLGQCYFIANDVEIYFEEKDQRALCRALNINEDLGQIKFVFSDKTGTLTENKMEFRRCSIAGKNYVQEVKLPPGNHLSNGDEVSPRGSREIRGLDATDSSDVSGDDELAKRIKDNLTTNADSLSPVKEFLTLMAICNTVVVSSSSSHHTDVTPASHEAENFEHGQALEDGVVNAMYMNGRTSDQQGSHRTLTYEAESPDEAALVKAASMYGYKLMSRGPENITINVPGEGAVKYHLLHLLAFDSIRKRMSVIVRRENDDKIILYCKGADTAIFPHLSRKSKAETLRNSDVLDALDGEGESPPNEASLVEITETHLNVYAREGLRTLCMARKELAEEDYHKWLSDHKKAELSLHNREKLLQESYDRIECNFELLGATGIEDKLQDGVPEAIATLRAAGLKVWVLTGDKQETAVNIAHSCNLLDEEMDKITLNANSQTSCADQIKAWLDRMSDNQPSNNAHNNGELRHNQQRKYGLIIDGKTLHYALEYPLALEFLLLAKSCQVVVCCRAAPVQKASVVRLVRDELRVMTLAIGDGANDVSMIQVADIGVGISGQEGMQAVQASDFAIGRFRFLVRLLLVHGHWCYDRIARMILYFFYKNTMFVMVLFWFQLYNGFSGSNAVNDLNLIFFNLIFTSLPPIICAIWDQDLPAETLLKKPCLYKQGQECQLYSRKLFWMTMADALFQSAVIFFSAFLVYYGLQSGLYEVGITLNQCAVVVASLHLAIETSFWTIYHVVVLVVSVLLSFLWCIFYNVILPTLPDYFVAVVTMGSAEFWMLLILTAVAALLPRFLARTLQQSLWPTEIQKARISSDPAVSLTGCRTGRRKMSSENNAHPHASGVSV